MQNFIIIAVVLIIVGLATFYIIKERKKGNKCIGCSSSGSCPHCQGKKKTPNK